MEAVGFVEVGLICQEFSLAALLVDLALQLPTENIPKHGNLVLLSFHCGLTWQTLPCLNHFRNDFSGNRVLQLLEKAVGQI